MNGILNNQQRYEIVEKYNSGLRVEDIATEYNCSNSNIYIIINKAKEEGLNFSIEMDNWSSKNESNKRYNKLFVTNNYRHVMRNSSKAKSNSLCIEWLCKCDCGNEVWVKAISLRNGHTQSCGCLIKDVFEAKKRKKDSKYFFNYWVSRWKTQAKTRGIYFNLTIKELDDIFEKQNGLCYYTGRKLLPAETRVPSKTESNISLDRVDSSLGYTKDNIVMCVKNANLAKHVLSHDTFIQLCIEVAENCKNKQFTENA